MTLLRCLLLSIGLLTCGCATYQPPNLPKGQTAVLSLAPPGGMRQIDFKAVDGNPLTVASALLLSHARAPVTLAPGKHTVKVLFRAVGAQGHASLWLVAEPGKAYLLHCENAGYKFRCWIDDKETGQPVGGVVGGSDEPS